MKTLDKSSLLLLIAAGTLAGCGGGGSSGSLGVAAPGAVDKVESASTVDGTGTLIADASAAVAPSTDAKGGAVLAAVTAVVTYPAPAGQVATHVANEGEHFTCLLYTSPSPRD